MQCVSLNLEKIVGLIVFLLPAKYMVSPRGPAYPCLSQGHKDVHHASSMINGSTEYNAARGAI